MTQNLPGAAELAIGPADNNGAAMIGFTVTASNGGGTSPLVPWGDGTSPTTYQFPGLTSDPVGPHIHGDRPQQER